jgi:hypothetical protein
MKWKRNVYETVAVDMTDFAMAQAEFRTAKTMRRVRDLVPSRNRLVDLLVRSANRHSFTLGVKSDPTAASCHWMHK